MDTLLPYGDYVLTEDGGWFSIAGRSVELYHNPKRGILRLAVYAENLEDGTPIASMEVFLD